MENKNNALTLTPFSDYEKKEVYKINSFKENGLDFAVLIGETEISHRLDVYKFGVMLNDGNYFWFWKGKAFGKNRAEAIDLYNELRLYCIQNELGIPFAYKPGKKN
jgi:hypothetical protein